MSNFGRSLRKTVELKNHSVPNDKAPSQTEKEKFSSINLLTVIPPCWSLRKTTHQEASFWSSEPWDKSWSLARILHQAPDTARQRLSFKICGEVVGRRSDRMEGAVIRYISNGLDGGMKILRLAAITPLAPRQTKFQNCGTWKGPGFLYCPCFGRERSWHSTGYSSLGLGCAVFPRWEEAGHDLCLEQHSPHYSRWQYQSKKQVIISLTTSGGRLLQVMPRLHYQDITKQESVVLILSSITRREM